MRWWLVGIVLACWCPITALSAPAPTEIGVLTCTLGKVIDTPGTNAADTSSAAREMVCTFKPTTNTPEETYVGTIKTINVGGTLPEAAVLWKVKAAAGTEMTAGVLQQVYAADQATPSGQVPALIGEPKGDISLHSMADKEEGSASQEKQTTPQFLVTAVELMLKASTG